MKTRFVALAVAATLGLGSVSAFAQDHHNDRRGQSAWQHQRGDQGRSDWSHNRHYTAPRHYAPSYGYRHDSGDVFGAVVLGALAGALVGQATTPYSYSPPPAAYYPAPPAGYYPPPPAYYNPGYGYYGY